MDQPPAGPEVQHRGRGPYRRTERRGLGTDDLVEPERIAHVLERVRPARGASLELQCRQWRQSGHIRSPGLGKQQIEICVVISRLRDPGLGQVSHLPAHGSRDRARACGVIC